MTNELLFPCELCGVLSHTADWHFEVNEANLHTPRCLEYANEHRANYRYPRCICGATP